METQGYPLTAIDQATSKEYHVLGWRRVTDRDNKIVPVLVEVDTAFTAPEGAHYLFKAA